VTFVQYLHAQLTGVPILNEDIMRSLDFIEQSALRQRALVRDIQLYLAAITPLTMVKSVSAMKMIDKVLKHHGQLIRETNARVAYANLHPLILTHHAYMTFLIFYWIMLCITGIQTAHHTYRLVVKRGQGAFIIALLIMVSVFR